MMAFAVHFDPELPERIEAREPPAVASASPSSIGEYRGDLDFLQDCHTGPDTEGGSNHYFDLWRSGALPVLARVHGLTNNRALFVDSHGKAGCSRRGSGYGYYPNDAVLEPGQKVSYFSAGDFATVLGAAESAQIHNVVLAGCNEDGRFRSGEFRRHFVNATNITYMSPGELSFKPMFYQAITLPSYEIKPLFGRLRRLDRRRVETEILDRFSPGAQPLGSYVADLYLPGVSKPYRTQKAGRELLEPGVSAARTLRADAEVGFQVP